MTPSIFRFGVGALGEKVNQVDYWVAVVRLSKLRSRSCILCEEMHATLALRRGQR